MHGVDEEDNVLVVLTPKFAGNTIALPDPPHVDNGPAREAALLLLAHRQCAPLRRTENDFVHIAVTGVVELVNQYNSIYISSHKLNFLVNSPSYTCVDARVLVCERVLMCACLYERVSVCMFLGICGCRYIFGCCFAL
jgi:hypothetical protein